MGRKVEDTVIIEVRGLRGVEALLDRADERVRRAEELAETYKAQRDECVRLLKRTSSGIRQDANEIREVIRAFDTEPSGI